MEMNNIDLLREFYKQFNLRGCLGEIDKKRIDKSVNRVPKKIGHKIDDILDTIFDSELKFILERETFRNNYKNRAEKLLERFEVMPLGYKVGIMKNSKFMILAFFNYLIYSLDFKEPIDSYNIIFPRKNFKEKEKSIINNIFKWLEGKYPELDLWGEIDDKNLYDWQKVKKTVIIGTESIIKLKMDLKNKFPEIIDEDLEAFGVMLFFGRVIWKNYLEIKKTNPFIGYLLNLVYLYIKRKEQKEKEPLKYYKKTFITQKFLEENLKIEGEGLSNILKNNDKKDKILLKIYNSNKVYKRVEIKLKSLKKMSYKEIKKNYKELLEIKSKSNVEKISQTIVANYILVYALKEKDEKFWSKLFNELKYKMPLVIKEFEEKKINEYITGFDEIKKEFLHENIIVLKLIENAIQNPIIILEEPRIKYWTIKNTNIIKLIPEIIVLKIRSKIVRYPIKKDL